MNKKTVIMKLLKLELRLSTISREDLKAKYYIYTTDTNELVFIADTLKEIDDIIEHML